MIQRFLVLWLLLLVAPWARSQTVTIPANSMIFTQSGSGTVPTVTTVGPTVTDPQGNKWSITAGGGVQINSQALSATANVVEITVVNGSLWQLNKAGNWYEATAVTGTAPNQTVTWSGGTTTSPIPSSTVTFVGPATALTLPVTGGSGGLPAGITWTPASGSTPAVLTIAGNVSATELQLNGTNTMPACPSLFYVWQYTPSTNTLSPACLPLIRALQP